MPPDTIEKKAKDTLKKSGKLTYDPAAYSAGYIAGVKAASDAVREMLEKFVQKGVIS